MKFQYFSISRFLPLIRYTQWNTESTTLSDQSNRKIVERGKVNILAHKYMTVHFPCLTGSSTKSGEIELVL
jgi:hypothetical protein